MPKRPPTLKKLAPNQDALSAEDEIIFNDELSKIWQGLMTFPTTACWKNTVVTMPSEEWQSQIASHIPTSVKSILVSPQPPTLSRLKYLAWLDTADAGVFVWCFKPNGKQVTIEMTDYLYIDSSSRYRGGLSLRKRGMLLPTPRTQD